MKKILSVLVLILILNASSDAVDVTKFPGHECLRECTGESRICYFKWHLEFFHALGPSCGSCGLTNGNFSDCFNPQCITTDGTHRGVMSINRQIPGPSIHVCENDFVVIDVMNMMAGTSTSIHWHGLHQEETPWMDGVPFLTQCPIHFGNNFRYSFKAKEVGTNFYHAHSGHHEVNGIYGGFVIRKAIEGEKLYDHDLSEHLIIASDWMDRLGEEFTPGLQRHPRSIMPQNYLINGRGIVLDPSSNQPTMEIPMAVFHVQSGQRYRFRFVNTMAHSCSAQLQIENHTMEVISSDISDIQPVTVDRLITTSGERYDFVINANKSEGQFWIRLKGLQACSTVNIQQFAVLSYNSNSSDEVSLSFPMNKSFPAYDEDFPSETSLNDVSIPCGDGKNFCISDLLSTVEQPDITEAPFDHQFFLGLRMQQLNASDGTDYRYHNVMYTFYGPPTPLIGYVNNISLTHPSFPFLTQPEDIREEMFCDAENLPEHCNGRHICPCVHRLKVKLNSIVEFILIDEATAITSLMSHPFHMHGYKFYVVGGGFKDDTPMTVERVKELVKNDPEKFYWPSRKFLVKDTVGVPPNGFAIIRMKATNPGFWIFHCHFAWHMSTGMGVVLQVGELNEMRKAPKDFPKCNSYTPKVRNEEETTTTTTISPISTTTTTETTPSSATKLEKFTILSIVLFIILMLNF